MDFYVLKNDLSALKQNFIGFKDFKIINIDDIISKLGYDINKTDKFSEFIINQEVRRIIKLNSKYRYENIIYVNKYIDNEGLRELLHYTRTITKITDNVLLTHRNDNDELFELFDKVIFFSGIKKIRLLECVRMPMDIIDSNDNNFY